MNHSTEDHDRDSRLSTSFERYQMLWTGAEPEVDAHDDTKSTSDTSIEECYHVWLDFTEQLEARNELVAFEASLSRRQQQSFTILRDYFAGTYHNDDRPFQTIQDVWHRLVDGNNQMILFAGDEVLYTQAIASLFILEMQSSSTHVYLMSSLISWRTEAFKQATAQRTAYSCLVSCRMIKTVESNQQAKQHSGPFLIPQSSQSSRSTARMPYYLWDVAREQTVVVSELEYVPAYTCISHTWGRWTLEDLVKLDGVDWLIPGNSRFEVRELPLVLKRARWETDFVWLDLVCIPQLDFDLERKSKEISNQGAIFVGAAACVAWFNDVSSWEGLMPSIMWLGLSYLQFNSGFQYPDVEEFALKAQIDAEEGRDMFRKQEFPVIEPDVTQLEELDPDINEDMQSRMESFHSQYCCERPPEACATHLRALSANCSEETGFDYAHAFGFPDWFTSLWTLQEACLFPEMSLASADFEYLAAATGENISLEAIYFLQSIVRRPKPRSVIQLSLCFRHDFGLSTPMDVFIIGNERQCTADRAPAIMSVMEITEWYGEQIASTGRARGDQDLVLGKYAMAFVQEAVSKIGPLFFGAYAIDGLQDGLGSMLPFYAGTGGAVSFAFSLAGVRKDAEGCEWLIDRSGQVGVGRAITFGAHRGNEYGIAPTETRASIYGLNAAGGGDLQETLDSLGNTGENGCAFAVHLSQDTIKFMGIILAGIRSSVSGGIVLAKVAAYEILYDVDMAFQVAAEGVWPRVPPPKDVDWIVF